MKQSDFDKELRTIAKAEAKQRGWKFVGGISYWSIGPLFFVFLQSASAKEGSFYSSLRFKWLALDSALWRILGMSDNENEPFSLHANGAFALTGKEIYTASLRSLQWTPGIVDQQVKNAMDEAFTRSTQVAEKIDSIEAYLSFIEREHAEFMGRHPRAATNIWMEALLVAILRGDHARAAEIARARISANDTGDFIVGGRGFYQRALVHCE